MMLLVMILPLMGQTEEEEPDLSAFAEDTVEVPLQYMKNALWYYDHYFIVSDVVEAQEEVIIKKNELLDEWEQEFDKLYVENRRVEAALKNWKIVGLTTGIMATVLLFLEVWDETHNDRTNPDM